jgi:glycosyltransferase involved in cell wall biosynthesis
MGDSAVVYYVPKIQPISSITEYQHSTAIANCVDKATLITEITPPPEIATAFEHVHILDQEYDSIHGPLDRIRGRAIGTALTRALRAARIANRRLRKRGVYVTTFHYIPALSGWFSNKEWIIDVYDDPTQILLNRPDSQFHKFGVPILKRLLNRADAGYNVLHPDSENTFGQEITYGINGAPTAHIKPKSKPDYPPLHCIVVGKTEPHQGMELLLPALAMVENPIHIDIFGEPFDESLTLAREFGVKDSVTFHGNQPHSTVVESIATAHVGLSVLPRRTDWMYSYPIKIGEYLAGGVIPVATDLLGTRRIGGDACYYVNPDPKQIATSLDEIATMDEDRFQQCSTDCRQQAERIAWTDERERFGTVVKSHCSQRR